MAKSRKKKRVMKKTVRKTIGALFLASAIVVAAIPADGLKAGVSADGAVPVTPRDNNFKVTISQETGSASPATGQYRDMGAAKTIPTMDRTIPVIKSTDKIYVTEKNPQGAIFQFAYINYNGDYVAVLMGYSGGTLVNNTLTIPSEVAAYIQPSGNMGTGYGYVAASKNGTPLYYERLTPASREKEVTVQKTDDNGLPVYDTNGDPVMVTETQVEEYTAGEMVPCYETDNAWKSLDLAMFYYEVSSNDITSTTAKRVDNSGNLVPQVYSGFAKSGQDTNYQWIKNAQVKYIGNQYLDTSTVGGIETWSIGSGGNYIDTADRSMLSRGVFANESNIETLEIPDTVLGIGNAAFYNCASLKNITLGNGVMIFGNWAFGSCSWLQKVDVPTASRLVAIGDHAFYGCSSLTSMQVPHVVKYIGDYAFAECSVLRDIELCDFLRGPSGSGLEEVGWSVFENCETLNRLELPENLEGPLDMSIVKGCRSLQYIRSRNSRLTFDEGDQGYGYDDFKAMLAEEPVNGKFYFEGLTGSGLHTLSKDKCFAFSHIIYDSNLQEYVLRNRYELTLLLNEAAGVPDGVGTFVVGLDGDQDNTLLECTLGSQVEDLEIPNAIGPKSVGRIKDNVFANTCSLKLIHIPENMTYIGAGAFKGCHNVKDVIFDTSTVYIGKDAFKTQDYTAAVHAFSGCAATMTDANNSPAVKLNFIGEISDTSTPFLYAMSKDGSYNSSGQNRSFITYYSGWPTNLEVQYQFDERTQTGYSELVNFPTISGMSEYTDTNKYIYMKDHAGALSGDILAYYNNNTATQDQAEYVRSVLSVDIPKGVQKIKDGLFYEKNQTEQLGAGKTVNVYSLDMIEEADFHKVNNYGSPAVSSGDLARDADGRTIGSDRLVALNVYGDVPVIADQALANLRNLQSVAVNGSTSEIGDYAFENCPNLEDVTLSGSVSSLGICPFKECTKLSNVVFQGRDYYTCEDSMIFNADKTKLIECLPAKGKFVKGTEVSTVKDIAQEAFSGTNVQEVDLTSSSITSIPTLSFANTSNLRTVRLPSTCEAIEDFAFKNSKVDTIEMSQYLTLAGPNAFAGISNLPKDVTFSCPENSYMHKYANIYGFDWTSAPIVVYYKVIFMDYTIPDDANPHQVGDSQWIKAGDDAVPPEPAGRPGKVFAGWAPDYRQIGDDTTCFAQYVDPGAVTHTVTFRDWDSTFLKDVTVVDGGDIFTKDIPVPPERPGYTFIGWAPGTLTNITADLTVIAQYQENKDAEYIVTFKIKTDDGEIVHATQVVKHGRDAIVPQDPVLEGQTFKGWWPEVTNVTHNMDTYAQFVPNGSIESTRFTVLFLDYDETVLSTQHVYSGESAVVPQSPSRDGYKFIGWLPSDVSNVTENMKVYAQYEKLSDDESGGGGGGGGGGGTSPKLYNLTVRNGSGSGSYIAGSQPIIIANDPPAGQEFSNWTIDPEDTKIASKILSASVVTMPAKDVIVTANFRAKTGNTTTGGNAANNNTNRPGGTGGVVSNGTTVVIDKNGISNTGVVSATVHGSSDNFTIKVTESSAAAEAVLRALQAEYGSLDNIKYFPMDISLYDATGTKKITDTTGLSIAITLPLPDSLITYAGNNKVAGVVNDRLDKLSPRFTTIDGVACVSFTAEHFSPYVIYVETNHLTQGTNLDSTPKTGDGIHPKWFLSIGLACMSAVFFMKKDKRNTGKVKAA